MCSLECNDYPYVNITTPSGFCTTTCRQPLINCGIPVDQIADSVNNPFCQTRATQELMDCLSKQKDGQALCAATLENDESQPNSSGFRRSGRTWNPKLLASVALALVAFTGTVSAQGGQGVCNPGEFQSCATDVHYDTQCNDYKMTSVVCTPFEFANSGDWTCGPSDGAPWAGLNGPASIRPAGDMGPVDEFLISSDASCPPSGFSQVETRMIKSSGCIPVDISGGEGITCFPAGGSGLARRGMAPLGKRGNEAPMRQLFVNKITGEVWEHSRKYPNGTEIVNKRETPRDISAPLIKRENCDGFRREGQPTATMSPSARMGATVSCPASANEDCEVTYTEGSATTITSTWSISSGTSGFGFDFSASFGGEYSEEVSLDTGYTLKIPPGTSGFLSASAPAQLWNGVFTGCENGDEPGQVLAINGSPVYSVVFTG